MKKFSLLLFFAFFFAVAASAQTNQTSDCPTVDVSGGGIIQPGESMTFTVNVEKFDLTKLSFKWTVSGGEILEGQGTLSIKVLKKNDVENTTATVEIEGLPEGCQSTESETGSVIIDYRSILVEEYGKIIFAKERTKLDIIAARLSENVYFSKYATVYFIVYLTNKQKPAEIKARQANIEKYLIETHKIPKNRINFVLSDSDAYLTKVWLVPPSADAPQP
jgi:hypothetical protein